MAIVTYDKTSKTKLTKNFSINEFSCQGRGCCSTVMIDSKLAGYLQQIRDHFGKSVTITSGYRCAKHNASVGGASGSYHTKGMAADIQVKGVAPKEVAKFAESIGVLGIGLYSNFVHVDTRTTKFFWYGHEQSPRTTFGGTVSTTNTTSNDTSYTQTQFIKDLQKIFGLTQTGTADSKLLAKTVTISAIKNYKHAAVKPLQKYLYALGYTEVGTADGVAGNKFEQALINYQSKNSCTADGELTAGHKTWKKILGMK